MEKLRVHKKSFILIVVVLLVLGAGIAVGFYFFNNKNDGAQSDEERWATAQAEANKKLEDSAKFADIVKAYNEKKYEEVTGLSKEFGGDASHTATERLNAYNMCIDAARILERDSDKTECYNKAKAVADGLSDNNAKTNWNIMLLNTRDNTQTPTVDEGEGSLDPQ